MGLPWWLSGKETTFSAGNEGQEDPLEEGMATHSSIRAWRIPWTEEAWQATVHSVSKSDTTEAT